MKKSKPDSPSSKPSSPDGSSSALSQYQKFQVETISRAQIKCADYNPRTITDFARAKLKRAIKKHGLVGTLVWNRRTGNLVSGHQRLSILDELSHSKDYSLSVSVIDVDEKTEKELNVFMNNASTQGDWDTQKLDELIKSLDFDTSGLGFDPVELQALSSLPELAGVFDPGKDKASADISAMRDISNSVQRKARGNAGKQSDDPGFYVIVVFRNSQEVETFLTQLGYAGNQQYIDGHRLANQFGIAISVESAGDTPITTS